MSNINLTPASPKWSVIITRYYDSIESETYLFEKRNDAFEFMQAEYFRTIMEEIREESMLVSSGCGFNAEELSAKISWEDGWSMEFSIAEVKDDLNDRLHSSVPAETFYELYKHDWCRQRGWSYDEVSKAEAEDMEYNGQMWVCFAEFKENEYQEDGYIDSLISDLELLKQSLHVPGANPYNSDSYGKPIKPFVKEGN